MVRVVNLLAACGALVVATLLIHVNKRLSRSTTIQPIHSVEQKYDAIIVPGGGCRPDGLPHKHVQERLRKAWERRTTTRYFILLSRGTTHKPPPIHEETGFPIDECKSSANFLYAMGQVEQNQILLECWSFDTIGNAVATLFFHVLPLRMKNVLVITNKFHLDRTKSVFQHIFSLSKRQVITAEFISVEDKGIGIEALRSRIMKEKQALSRWKMQKKR